jgi:tetratricopeptide (TPR) repeat protein
MSQWDMARGTHDERIDAARRAIALGDWSRALDSLEIDPSMESTELLELRADALYGAGDFEGCVGSWEDLHSLLVRRGDEIEAGRVAAMVAMYLMMDTGLMAPVRGWLRCADRHLDGVDDHPVRAIIAMVRAYERFMCGSMSDARTHATLAIELGERFGVVPAVVIGRTCIARLTIFDGDVATGLELLDEVGALLMSGAADPLTTGMMYCEIICAAQGLLMPDLAAQWTSVMEHWRHGAAIGGINGRCRVHRAEVLRISGTCDLAEAEAIAACDELRPWMRREFGWPLVELGNVRLRSGDLDGAEQAFADAAALSWSPQPGLALVHLARGEVDVAATMIAHAIEYPIDIPSKERPPFGPLRLAPLYDAQATIASVRRDRPTLERAAAELADVAAAYPSPVLRANELLARGRLSLLDSEPGVAIALAGRAVAEFEGVGAPFEAALARLVLAKGYEAAGRGDDAAIEQRAARAALTAFGARWWADRVNEPPGSIVSPAAESEPAAAPTGPRAVFRADGDTRTIEWGPSSVVVRDLKGYRYIERLLAEPGREFHAIDLARLDSGADPRVAVATGIAVLDRTAREAYRRRLADVDEDIADAQANNDLARIELAERDRDYLLAELRRATGLGGRDRTVSDDAERARTSVTRSIRYALSRLAESSPHVAEHLRQHVSTGAFCHYERDPLQPVDWTV